MKIFLDSAEYTEIEELSNAGILDGITTNPSLIKKAVEESKKKGEKIDMASHIKKILKLLGNKRPVSLEVIGTKYYEMVNEGLVLYKKFNPVAKNVYIKIPISPLLNPASQNYLDGIKAIKTLSQKGIPINCTLIFAPEQALLAAKAGAKIVSPFAGRIDDYLREKVKMQFRKEDYFPAEGLEKNGKLLEDNGIFSGAHLVMQIVEIFQKYKIKAEVLAASIRNARQLRETALLGADIATAPFYVIKQALNHEKSIEGMKKFKEDVVREYSGLFKK